MKPKEGQGIKVSESEYTSPVPHPDNQQYYPGQWLDVHCPGTDRAGGFTITSAPPLLSRKQAQPVQTASFSSPYIELAIQKSANNPPAAYMWQDEDIILGKELDVRVGGSFVWPPEQLRAGLKRVVFIAGGVGINPFMSMLSSIAEMKQMRGKLGLGFDVRLLYSVKLNSTTEEILFLDRLKKVFEFLGEDGHLSMFVTGAGEETLSQLGLDHAENSHSTSMQRRRILEVDLEESLGFLNKRSDTVCYICGPPAMTDHFIGTVKAIEGIQKDNVLFEKWW